MMTTHEDNARSEAGLVSALHVALANLAAVFLMGACAGFVSTVFKRNDGFDLWTGGVLALLALLTAAAIWWALRMSQRALRANEPLAPRVRKARHILFALLGVGLVAGIALGAMDGAKILSEVDPLYGEVPPLAAAFLIGVFLVAVPLTWVWYRTIDELEARAYDLGAVIALHGYMFAVPVWWMAWRGGFAPAPDGITIYFVTMLVWSVGWLWRRPR